MEYITGNESVQDLMDMIDRQDDPSGVISLICLTTANTNPATFHEFIKELKNQKPGLLNKNKDKLKLFDNDNKKSSGCFNLFGKSPLKKALKELRDNKLYTVATLLKSADNHGYEVFSEDRKIYECEMLKKNFDVQKGPANESLNRFKWAKEICENHNLIKETNFFENYVDVYRIYLKKYCNK